jgi:hypothetical protein
LERRCLVQFSVRPVGVEVHHVLGQHCPKLALVEDQHPIQQLAADGADPSLGDGVRPRCPHRGAQGRCCVERSGGRLDLFRWSDQMVTVSSVKAAITRSVGGSSIPSS